MTKRDLVTCAFRNETPERTPVGFWIHYAADELVDGFEYPAVFDANLAGHRKFYADFQPDMVKIMTDGFFMYPNKAFIEAETLDDLRSVSSIGSAHPWIERQVAFAASVRAIWGEEVPCFYTIFSPTALLKFGNIQRPGAMRRLMAFEDRDPPAVQRALAEVAKDLAELARRVISEAKVDGIYYSVQDPADSRFDHVLQVLVHAPADRLVLEAANSAAAQRPAGMMNILHICGYDGRPNRFANYRDYPVQAFNWSTSVQKISLAHGKRLLGGKPVLGGFDNTADGVLYKGGRDAVQAETKRLLREAGTAGVILGADCTLPRDINLDHLRWVRDAAAAL
jgi:uroporphyrinogen decarboxylase